MFILLFPSLAAVDRRRRKLSDMTILKRKGPFAIRNMYSHLYALKGLITKQVYFNTLFIKKKKAEEKKFRSV